MKFLIALLSLLLLFMLVPMEQAANAPASHQNLEDVQHSDGVCTPTYALQEGQSDWSSLYNGFDDIICPSTQYSYIHKGSYNVAAKNVWSDRDLIAISTDAASVRFSPQTLFYRNEQGQTENIANARAVSAVITGNQISYPGIFGPGTVIRYTSEASTFKEELIIERPLPASTLPGVITLDMEVILSTDDTTTVRVEETPLTTTTKGGWATIEKQSNSLFVLPPAVARDARGQETHLTYTFQPQGKTTLITLHTPYSVLEGAYPLIIDPTLVLGSSSTNFDGTVRNLTAGVGAYTRIDDNGLFIGRNNSGGIEQTLRSAIFFNIGTVPQNAVITDVNLTVFVNTTETFNDRLAVAGMENNSTYYPDIDAGNKEFFIDMENGTAYNTLNITGISTDFFTFPLGSSVSDVSFAQASTRTWFGFGLISPIAESRNFISDDAIATHLSSSEDANTSQRPYLTIAYILPQPQPVPISPQNASEVGGMDFPILTFRVTDNENVLTAVEVYGDNGTGISPESILYQNLSVLNNSILTFNWTSPLARWNKNTVLLAHFDNRSAYAENATNIFDFSFAHHNGTARNALPNLTAGKFAGSFAFAGNGNVTFDNIPTIGNFTCAVWVQSFSTSGNRTIINTMNDTDSGLWILQKDTNLSVYANSSAPALDIQGIFSKNSYVHLIIAATEKNISVFVNGEFNASANISGVSTNLEQFTLGSRRNRSFFVGNMDELQVFNRTLSASEIRNLTQFQSRTYYWKISATDATPDTNTSATVQFDYNIPPIITAISPLDQVVFTGVGEISVNASAEDASSPLNMYVYGSNSNPPSSAELLYQKAGASVLNISYNWTAPVQTKDTTTVLILHFDNQSAFGESDTVVHDFSPLQNNALCTSCPATNTSFGKFGGTFDFDGSSVFTISSPNRLDLNASFSVEMWINPSVGSASLTTKDVMLSKGVAYQFFHDNTSQTIDFRLAGITCNATSQLAAQTWYHIASVFNGTTLFMYVNGILENTCPADPPTSNANDVRIGAGTAGDFFHGKIDELVVRNVSLSSTQIRDHYRLREGQYFWTVNATDSAGSHAFSSIHTFNVTRYLEVMFISPQNNTNLPIGSTFLANVSIICRAETCGSINGTLFYNGSDANPDTPIAASGPFTLVAGEVNPKACNDPELVNNEFCNLTWMVNVTGTVGERYTLGSRTISNMTGIQANSTFNNTVAFISCLIDLFPQFSSVTFFTGVPGSIINGSGNLIQTYNITTGSTNTCNVDVYLKSTDLNFSSDPNRNIGVRNMSFGNTSNLYTDSWVLTSNYQMLRSNIPISTNITSFYWMRVPPAFAGDYSGIITYMGVKTGELPI